MTEASFATLAAFSFSNKSLRGTRAQTQGGIVYKVIKEEGNNISDIASHNNLEQRMIERGQNSYNSTHMTYYTVTLLRTFNEAEGQHEREEGSAAAAAASSPSPHSPRRRHHRRRCRRSRRLPRPRASHS